MPERRLGVEGLGRRFRYGRRRAGHRRSRGFRDLGRGEVVNAESERFGQAVAAVRAGRAGAALVLLDERCVVRLEMLTRLDGRAQPDLPGDLAAHLASSAAGPGLVVLVDLEVVVVIIVVDRTGVTEHLTHLADALRYPVQRGSADDQEAEGGEQREQRRRHPRGQGGRERAGHRVAQVAPGRADRRRSGRRMRCALGQRDQAGHAEQQRGPADGRPGRFGVTVGVAQVTPGQQRGQHRRDPGERPQGPTDHDLDDMADRVAHPGPQAGREHDGHAQGEQADAVPAMVRIQVASAAADSPDEEPEGPGDHHPGGREGAAEPADQDHDRIAGPVGCRPSPGRTPLR